jgi:hypothetical protein
MNTDFSARVADGGRMTVVLKNHDGYFSKDSNGVALSEGMIKFVCKWDGAERIKFFGYYEPGTKKFDGNPNGARTCEITYMDWMAWAMNWRIDNLTYKTNYKINHAVRDILLEAPLHHGATEMDEGYYTFPDMFDIGSSETTIGGEFNKLATSEFGYIYLRFTHPEMPTLVVFNRSHRSISNGSGTISELPVKISDHNGSKLLLQDGVSKLLLQDGVSKLLLENNQAITITGDDIDESGRTEFVRDKHIYANIKVSVKPRTVDTSYKTLWTMESSLKLEPGETVAGLRGRYRDPSGGASYINGFDMQYPVTNTDYKAYSNSDGTGTDLTSNLQVDAIFHRAEVELTLSNKGATTLYTGGDILFQVRGKGVYVYDEVRMQKEIGKYEPYENPVYPYGGKRTIEFDMYYASDPKPALGFANLLYWKSVPRTTCEAMSFNANRNSKTMRLWMYGDVGTSYYVNIENPLIDYLFYTKFNAKTFIAVHINGYKFEVIGNQYVNFTIIPFEDTRAYLPN